MSAMDATATATAPDAPRAPSLCSAHRGGNSRGGRGGRECGQDGGQVSDAVAARVEECDGSAIFFACVFVCLCVGGGEGRQQRSSQFDAALLAVGGAGRSLQECGVVGAMALGRVAQPAADLGVLSAHREGLLAQKGDVSVSALQSDGLEKDKQISWSPPGSRPKVRRQRR